MGGFLRIRGFLGRGSLRGWEAARFVRIAGDTAMMTRNGFSEACLQGFEP